MKSMVYYHLGSRRNERKPKKERHAYLSVHCLSCLMGWWRTLSPLLVLLFYIFMGGKQSFRVMSQKLCLHYYLTSRRKSTVLEKWGHQSCCSQAGAIQRFQRFYCAGGGSIWWSEPQGNHHWEIKNLTTGVLFCGWVYFTIQSQGFSDWLRWQHIDRVFEGMIKLCTI